MALAKRGNPVGIKALEVPDWPVELAYLWDWATELHGKSGVTEHGLSPLTPTTIKDWSELKGVEVAPHEMEALFMLDAVMSFPGEEKDD